MRSHLLTITAGAGLALSLIAAPPARSITITTPAGVRQAADALDLIEAVHCRKYLHRHKNEQRRSRGCGEATRTKPRGSGGAAPASLITPLPPLAPIGRPAGNYLNPMNPQDRSGNLNRQDMTQPRSFNPQDMR